MKLTIDHPNLPFYPIFSAVLPPRPSRVADGVIGRRRDSVLLGLLLVDEAEGALVRRDVGASASTVTEGDVVIVDVNEPVVGDTIDRFRPRRSAHLQMEYDRHIREVRQIAERNRLQALPGAEDSSIPGQRRGSSLPRITLTPDLEEDVEGVAINTTVQSKLIFLRSRRYPFTLT